MRFIVWNVYFILINDPVDASNVLLDNNQQMLIQFKETKRGIKNRDEFVAKNSKLMRLR